MHPALLERYFDVERWHYDLLVALLTHRAEWKWTELSEAFMKVCCDLHSPRGSASMRADWMNHLGRLGMSTIKLEGEGEATITASSILPKAKRVILAAVRWSIKATEIEAPFKRELAVLHEQLNAFDIAQASSWTTEQLVELNRLDSRIKSVRASRDRALRQHAKKFRVAAFVKKEAR